MQKRLTLLWKANMVAFLSSFCVMVIELVAARILAPHIGVSLYTWTSIIGVILAGIALGNFLGGKVADKYPSPFVLLLIFLVGGLLTAAIIPLVKIVTAVGWFNTLPVMFNFLLKSSCIFILPAVVLSMVSPMVIKLTLADVGSTGGVVGTIYAFSTVGSILGTFLTGFYLILWFGTALIIWIIGGILIIIGIFAWFLWKSSGKPLRFKHSMWVGAAIFASIAIYLILFSLRWSWQDRLVKESNYYAINTQDYPDGTRGLVLDSLVHGYVDPLRPTNLKYDYLQVFAELTQYLMQTKPDFRVLHLGGGTYMLPRYYEAVYPQSENEVVEIDPAVTEVAYTHLSLPQDTPVVTHNQDARLFLIEREPVENFDIVIGDVFNDRATPYHLTTIEFDRLVKKNMTPDGIYMVNVIDNYRFGQYMPSFVLTLKRVFEHVYLFSPWANWNEVQTATFVIVATDRDIDMEDYRLSFYTSSGTNAMVGIPHDMNTLDGYISERKAIFLTDDHVPTDIFVSFLFRN